VTYTAVPSEAVLLRVFGRREEALGNEGGPYFQRCLLAAIREEPMPKATDLNAISAVYVRERVAELLPFVERIRAGEERLPEAAPWPPPPAVQDKMPF
jgi:hypothetical protein